MPFYDIFDLIIFISAVINMLLNTEINITYVIFQHSSFFLIDSGNLSFKGI